MLKKLVKIKEGSIVKIRTDGISLIITPHEPVAVEQVSPTVTIEDTRLEAQMKLLRQNNPDFDYVAFKKEMDAATKKHASELEALFSNQEYKEAQEKLNKKFGGDMSSSEFMKEATELRYAYSPDTRLMDEELGAIAKKYSPLLINKNFENARTAFKAIHEKYQHLIKEFQFLSTNEEYQHELALLSQKYQVTGDAQAYAVESAKLIDRFIPGYLAYEEEIKQASMLLEEQKKQSK